MGMSQLNQAVPSDLFCESLTSQLEQAVPRRCRSRGGYLGCLAIIAKFMIRRAASSRNSCLVCNKALVLFFSLASILFSRMLTIVQVKTFAPVEETAWPRLQRDVLPLVSFFFHAS